MTDSKDDEDDDLGDWTTSFDAEDSGTGHFIAAFHPPDIHLRRHGPSVAVYPGLPSFENRIIVTVPKTAGETPRVVEGDASKFGPGQLTRVFDFLELNLEALLRHSTWEGCSSIALLRSLKPVR